MSFRNLTTLEEAVRQLCSGKKIQSGEHIKPLHNYCAARLVVEGGFPPEWVNPRPRWPAPEQATLFTSFVIQSEGPNVPSRAYLAGSSIRTLMSPLSFPTSAQLWLFRRRTPEMLSGTSPTGWKRLWGECTNIHLMYPGFVFGFLHLIKFAKLSEVEKTDASFTEKGDPLPAFRRYHEVLISLSGRSTLTEPGIRYEAVALLAYRCREGKTEIVKGYPPESSPVHFSKFFQKLYDLYDLRYGYPDPDGPNIRKEWRIQDPRAGKAFDATSPSPWNFRLAD